MALVDSHYRLQSGVYFDAVQRTTAGITTASSIASLIWNHVYVSVVSDEAIDAAIEAVRRRAWADEVCGLYLDAPWSEALSARIAAAGLQFRDDEVWMELLDTVEADIPRTADLSLVRARGPEDERVFESLVGDAFGAEYASALRTSKTAEQLVEHHILELRREPIGAATILHLEGWTAIHDVCIAEPHRGRGMGRALVRGIVRRARELGGRVYLQCEGGPLEEFYSRSGFQEVARRGGFAR